MTQMDAMIQDVHCTLDAIPACPSSLLNAGLYIFGWSIVNHSVNSITIHPPFPKANVAISKRIVLVIDLKERRILSLLVDGVQECNISTSTFVPSSVQTYMSFPSMPLITPNITLHCLIVLQ